MSPSPMSLEVILPHAVFADEADVCRIVAHTADGSFGLLPHRRDCVAALVPGLLMYATQAQGEQFLAVDEGLLVKVGTRVTVAVRRAARAPDLARLHEVIAQDYRRQDAQARALRSAMAQAESGLLRSLARYEKA